MARQLTNGDKAFSGKEVRLISETNEQLGVVKFTKALQMAEEAGYDLVEVAGKADPPVCRIMDFGKYQYEQSKREKDARKKQNNQKVKEIKFHPNIDEHDYQTKLNKCIGFLEKGCKLKVSMFFRGREMAHIEIGQRLMERVVDELEEYGTYDAKPKLAGRLIATMIAPKSPKARAKDKAQKNSE